MLKIKDKTGKVIGVLEDEDNEPKMVKQEASDENRDEDEESEEQ